MDTTHTILVVSSYIISQAYLLRRLYIMNKKGRVTYLITSFTSLILLDIVMGYLLYLEGSTLNPCSSGVGLLSSLTVILVSSLMVGLFTDIIMGTLGLGTLLFSVVPVAVLFWEFSPVILSSNSIIRFIPYVESVLVVVYVYSSIRLLNGK